MGKSQANKLKRKISAFTKERQIKRIKVRTEAEAQRRMRALQEVEFKKQKRHRIQDDSILALAVSILPGSTSEVESKQIKHGENKSQSKSACFTKRFKRQQMA